MKKLMTSLLAIATCCSLVCVSSCDILNDLLGVEKYEWTLAELGNEVDFHTQAQKAYIAGPLNSISTYANGQAELSRPEAVEFSWKVSAKDDSAISVKSYKLEIATDVHFSDSVSYQTTESSYDVYNLRVATDYYWRVTSTFTDGATSVSPLEVFSTAATAPRNMYVDGITNFRDLGGWETEDGFRVKQGMIYRCGRLNESESNSVVIEVTEEGKRVLLEELGVKTEIDLRRTDNNEVGGITSSPLGDEVEYFACPMEWNVNNILTGNIDMVKNVFEILADEDNYPIIYHCNIGTDRTGLFAFLLNGLIGVPEEDLYRDYLFSNFGKIGGSRNTDGIKNSYVATLKTGAGATLSEKIYNKLEELGIPAEQLDEIIYLLTE